MTIPLTHVEKGRRVLGSKDHAEEESLEHGLCWNEKPFTDACQLQILLKKKGKTIIASQKGAYGRRHSAGLKKER